MTDPADMRLRVSAEGKFSDTVASVSGRHEDSCMQGVLDFFTFEQMEHSHDH
jgi:hypothetical protein